jgi:uncharacterized repeat protein (TIGR02543 family)
LSLFGCGNAGGGPAGGFDPTWTVRGVILKLDDGSGLGGATVRLEDYEARSASGGVLTDDNGNYVIYGVSPGTYDIKVSHPGYEDGELDGTLDSITVTNDDIDGKDLILIEKDAGNFTVGGTITKSGGGNAAGAAVRLKKNGIPIGKPVTAEGGAYTTPAVPAGTYTIEVSLAGYETHTGSVTGTSSDVTESPSLSPISYSITYHLNGGSDPGNPANYTVESAAITLAAPTRSGDTFAGWYTDAGLTGPAVTAPEIPANSTGNKTFWAKWNVTTAAVILGEGSPGTAGNGTITGLTLGAVYCVLTGGDFYDVTPGGSLSSDFDMNPLTGTAITGLTNGETYTVFQIEQAADGQTINLNGKHNLYLLASYLRNGANKTLTIANTGTTSAKTVIVDLNGHLLAHAGAVVANGLEVKTRHYTFTFSATTGSNITLSPIADEDSGFTLSVPGGAFSTTMTSSNARIQVPITGVQLWDESGGTPYNGSADVKLGYDGVAYLTVGSVTGGIMTINFTPVSAIDWEAILCEGGNSVSVAFARDPGSPVVSPSGVKMGKDASLKLFSGASEIGDLIFRNSSGEYIMGSLCVDQAVTITGTSSYGIGGSTPYDAYIFAESGFNFFLMDTTRQTLTTEENLPAGMKWWVDID